VGIGDVLDQGQPEAGAVVLGGEVGIENPPGDLGGDTVPGILHEHQHVILDSHEGYLQRAS